jgi:hypothetical protein
VRCACVLHLVGVLDNCCASRFLSALVACLQAAGSVLEPEGMSNSAPAMSKTWQLSATVAIFRHGLPKMMPRKERKCQTFVRKKPVSYIYACFYDISMGQYTLFIVTRDELIVPPQLFDKKMLIAYLGYGAIVFKARCFDVCP